MRYLLVFGITALIAFACRKSGPTGPDLSDAGLDGILTVRQARSMGEPVAGATVMVVDGGNYTTDEHGQVRLPAVYDGRVIEVIASGFLQPRRVHYTSGMVDHLLPDDEQMPGAWLHEAYYQENNDFLRRPREGLISVGLSEELKSNALFMHAVRKGIEHVNRAQSSVEYALTDSGGTVWMELVPDDPVFSREKFEDAWAVITGEFEDGYIVSSRVAWKFITRPEHHNVDAQTLWQAVAHELGHHTGLWGHPVGGIMNEYTIPGLSGFNERERAALRYLFLRTVGTRRPDDSTWRPAGRRTMRVPQNVRRTKLVQGCFRHR